MRNVGQTIYVTGPLFLRMVLAVNLAVVVIQNINKRPENLDFFEMIVVY